MRRSRSIWLFAICLAAWMILATGAPLHAQEFDMQGYAYTEGNTIIAGYGVFNDDGEIDNWGITDSSCTVTWEDGTLLDQQDCGQVDVQANPGFEYYVSFDAQIGYYTDDEDDPCDYDECTTDASWSGSVYIPAPPPSISGPTTTNVLQGASGSITISGANLVGHDGSNPTLNISGSSGVTFTVSGTPTSSSAAFNYDATNATAGSYTLTVTTIDGTSSSPPTINFNVDHPPATVTGISPGVWIAGQSYTGVQITGTNFGSTPTVSFSDSTISVGVPYNTSTTSGVSMTSVDISIPATAPSEPVIVTVTPGSGGNTLTQPPGGASLPASATAVVVGLQQNACPTMLDAQSSFSTITPGTAPGGSGSMSVSFSSGSFNGMSVTVPYGPYSTPESIASHLAALITKQYNRSGLSAEAYGSSILYKGLNTLGNVSFTALGSSFAATPSPQSCPPVSINLRLVPVVSRPESQNYGNPPFILHNVWRLVTLAGKPASDYRVVEHIAVSRGGTEPDGQGGYQSPKNGVEAPTNEYNDGIGCRILYGCTASPPYWQKFTITQMNGPNAGLTVPVMTRIHGQDHLINTILERGTSSPLYNNQIMLPLSPDPYPQNGVYDNY